MFMVEELTADWAKRGKPTKTLKFNVSGLQGMTGKRYLHRQHNDQDKDSHKQDVEPPKARAVVLKATRATLQVDLARRARAGGDMLSESVLVVFHSY